MSYLLIGNISALICDGCIEPLAQARLRVYFPDRAHTGSTSMPSGLKQLSAAAVENKADRLVAEAILDVRGNFILGWDVLARFSDPLELDLALDHIPGTAPGRQVTSQFHLSTPVLHWKRSKSSYLAAFAYVMPSAHWNHIRANYGTWVVSGTVKYPRSLKGQPYLRVEAYNAFNDKLLGYAYTNEAGRYKIQFGLADIASGTLMPVRQGQFHTGPDVYFRVYRNNHLVWEEDATAALLPERRAIAPCTLLNITIRPSATGKAASPPALLPGGWQVMKPVKAYYTDKYHFC